MTDFELPASLGEQDTPALRASSLSLSKAFGLGFALLSMGTGLVDSPAGTMMAGNGAWLIYAVSIVIIGCLVVAVSAFSRRYVVTGSLMSYLGDAFGPIPRTIAGSALVLAYMVYCADCIFYLLTFVQGIFLDFDNHSMSGPSAQIAFCIIAPIGIGYISYRGAVSSARTAIILTVVSLPLVFVLFVAMIRKNGVDFQDQLVIRGGTTFANVIGGAAFFAGNYLGFEGFTALAAETENPRANIPKILTGLTATMVVGYLLATIVATPVFLQHASEIASGQSPSAILADASGVPWLKIPLDFAMVAGVVAAFVPLLNDGSRVIATAARDGILPPWLGRIDPQRRVPTRALWLLVAVTTLVPVVTEAFVRTAPLEIAFALAPAQFFLWMIPYMGICMGLVFLKISEKQLFSMAAVTGFVGFSVIGFLFCYQLSHPATSIERVSSRFALSAFALLCALYFLRSRLVARSFAFARRGKP